MSLARLESRWKACFTSIVLVSPFPILIIFFVALDFRAPSDIDNSVLIFFSVMFKWIIALLMGLFLYVLISLLGWLFIGMPISRLIEKSNNPSIFIYLAVSIFFSLCLGVFNAPNTSIANNLQSIAFFAIPIVLQTTIYKIYLNKIISHNK